MSGALGRSPRVEALPRRLDLLGVRADDRPSRGHEVERRLEAGLVLALAVAFAPVMLPVALLLAVVLALGTLLAVLYVLVVAALGWHLARTWRAGTGLLVGAQVLLGLVAIVVFPLLVATNVIYERKVSGHFERAQHQLGEFSAGVHESFEGVQLVKSYGA